MINTNCVLIYKGKKIRLCLAYNVVLKFFELQQDKELSDIEKLDTSMFLFVNNLRVLKRFTAIEKREIQQLILDGFIYSQNKKPQKKDKPVLSFKQDADLIFSSFMLDYGINLTEQENKMDWRVFIALFQGLSERTKIREVMSIRGMQIPKENEHNAKEIANITELKAFYEIEDDGAAPTESDISDGWGRLFGILEARAKNPH